MKIHPKVALVINGDVIKVTCQNNMVCWLRPRSKDPQAVCDDLNRRGKEGLSARLSDVSKELASEPWYFRYDEKIEGQKRTQPDPDAAILRDHEVRSGCA